MRAAPEEQPALADALADALSGEASPEALWTRARLARRRGRSGQAELSRLERGPAALRARARLLQLPLDPGRLRYERRWGALLAPLGEEAGAWGALLSALGEARSRPDRALRRADALARELGRESCYWAHLATLRDLQGRPAEGALRRALELDPADPRLRREQARRALVGRDVVRAASELELAARLAPEDPEQARLELLLRGARLHVARSELGALLRAARSPLEWELLADTPFPPDREAFYEAYAGALPDVAGAWIRLGAALVARTKRLEPALETLARGYRSAELLSTRLRLALRLVALVRAGAAPPPTPESPALARLLQLEAAYEREAWREVRPRWEAALAEQGGSAEPAALLLASELCTLRLCREPQDAVLAAAADFEQRCRERGAAAVLARWATHLGGWRRLVDLARTRLDWAAELDASAPEVQDARAEFLGGRRESFPGLAASRQALLLGRTFRSRARWTQRLQRVSPGLSKALAGALVCENPLSFEALGLLCEHGGVEEARAWGARFGPVASYRVEMLLTPARLEREPVEGARALSALAQREGLLNSDRLRLLDRVRKLGQREAAAHLTRRLAERWPRHEFVRELQAWLQAPSRD